MLNKKYPFFYQSNSMECGVACIKMITAFFGKKISNETIRSVTDFERSGTSMLGLQRTAESLGLKTEAYSLTFDEMMEMESEIPCIIHWNRYHFVILYQIKNGGFLVADPAKGLVTIKESAFCDAAFQTDGNGRKAASVMFFSVTDAFRQRRNDELITRNLKRTFFKELIAQRKNYFFAIIWLLFISLLIQFSIPFFTRSIVDIGITSGDLNMVLTLAVAQASVIFGRTLFDIVRSWLSLHLSIRINFDLIVRFLNKMFRLPLIFLETRKIGDMMQRITDNYRIESFLTGVTVSSAFSVLTIMVYSIVLCFYNYRYLLVFLASSIVYIIWNVFFLKKRQELDWTRFDVAAKNQSILIQMFSGIHDLRINSAEKFYFSTWEQNQKNIIRSNFEVMRLNQIQQTGSTVIYEVSQLLITLLSAHLVITNRISFGTMLAIQFIIGQLMGPMGQLMTAVISGHDAKISLDRLMDVWNVREESELFIKESKPHIGGSLQRGVEFRQVSFNYQGQETQFALNSVNLFIPDNKITAIVGVSGSGKTTMLKLLLGYYYNYQGDIFIDGKEFRSIDLAELRASCGAVLQESYIFNDTIANNITLGLPLDEDRLRQALDIACILEYVNELPLQVNTYIGNEGKGLSQGQKQRLLIARAVYRSERFLLLDEATNSLDAKTEAKIFAKLKHYFVGKTVIMVAHRLSTVQHADQIVVLDKGIISETGSHQELLENEGDYYNLIKAQVGNYNVSGKVELT